jgi:hypothetical protein
MFDQTMSTRFQFRALLEVVEKFTVENHEDAFVFVVHRLLAISQANNAEAPRSQPKAGPKKEALLVRAAVDESPRHPANSLFRHRSLLGEITYSRNPAHDYFSGANG